MRSERSCWVGLGQLLWGSAGTYPPGKVPCHENAAVKMTAGLKQDCPFPVALRGLWCCPSAKQPRSEEWATTVPDLLWVTPLSHEMLMRMVTSFTLHKPETENCNSPTVTQQVSRRTDLLFWDDCSGTNRTSGPTGPRLTTHACQRQSGGAENLTASCCWHHLLC